jgi:hypothetical protein
MLSKVKQVALGVAALTGAAVGGRQSPAPRPRTPAPPRIPQRPGNRRPRSGTRRRPGTAAHEDAEKPVTGDDAAKAQAAAVKAVGEGTAGDVTTDYFGKGYEVTVTKSDGSKVEIHLDSSFQVMQHGPGGRGGQPPPAAFGTFN